MHAGEKMNINALTLDEIIRTAEPETDLERRLLSFLTDARFVNLDEHECPDCDSNNLAVDDIKCAAIEAVDKLKEAVEILEG